ncbi:phage tail protein [Escherichia coli]|nr:phage tail protein [Escherichia coli]
MATKYYAVLTNIGAEKLANATALGAQVEITKMAVGDGNGTLPTPNPAQTALVHEQRRASLNTLSIDPNNANQIIAEQVIPEDVGGWWIREIGLFDKDGDLIAVANCAETYKPQLQEGSGRVQIVRMILIVSSTAAVTLKIDPSVVLATRAYVDSQIIIAKSYADDLMDTHLANANPHDQYPLIANALKEMAAAGLVDEVLKNLDLGEAAKRDVGTGENQIPDMASFASGDGWMKLPNGKILQYGRGAVTPTLSTQTMRITFSIPFPKKADCAMLTHSGDGGAPLGAGRGFVMTAEDPTLTGFNSSYRTSSTSDTVSMNYSWWAVGE